VASDPELSRVRTSHLDLATHHSFDDVAAETHPVPERMINAELLSASGRLIGVRKIQLSIE
jgi:hypothetical protein